MSLSLALAANAVLELGLLGGLAYVLSRPARLAPHQPASARPSLAAVAGGGQRAPQPDASRLDLAA